MAIGSTWWWMGLVLGTLAWPSNDVLVSPTAAPNGCAVLDSLPPSGTVQIKPLEAPSKKNRKKAPKAKPEKQVKVSKTRTRPTPSVATTPKPQPQPKAKATKPQRPQRDSMGAPSKVAVLPAGPSLSPTEELLLLSKVPHIEAPRLTHPSELANCGFGFDHVDEFTGVRKRGLKPRLLFAYTPEQYRQFIPEGDFIRGEGFLSQSSSGSMALNLDVYIASPVAQQKFGAIPPNASLLLRTIDGKEYYLVTYQGAEPRIVDQTTQYQCSFAISKRDLKALRTAEIDQVRLRFAQGAQTYEVYYLDFLRDQFPCFDEL